MPLASGDQQLQALREAFAMPDTESLSVLIATLVLGGVLAMYIRWLYRRTNARVTGDSIARVFPLLTLVTISVIAVVKSSLALSLGLVGALSIVRFRAAIKDPEELVYLFLCIGVGLALGAVQIWLAIALVVIATVFVLVLDRGLSGAAKSSAYLTVMGDAPRYFGADDVALAAVQAQVPSAVVERCHVDAGVGELRIFVPRLDPSRSPAMIAALRTALPDCDISYINASRLP